MINLGNISFNRDIKALKTKENAAKVLFLIVIKPNLRFVIFTFLRKVFLSKGTSFLNSSTNLEMFCFP